MSTEVRWKQRLQNLEKAMARLQAAGAKDSYTELEQAGLVQTYEFTFELAWNVFKDVLTFEGYDVRTPRATIRKAAEVGYIQDLETWILALDSRTVLSHTYAEQNAQEAVTLIKGRFLPMLTAAFAFLQTKKANE